MINPIVVAGDYMINLFHVLYAVPDEILTTNSAPQKCLRIKFKNADDVLLTKPEDITEFLRLCAIKSWMV